MDIPVNELHGRSPSTTCWHRAVRRTNDDPWSTGDAAVEDEEFEARPTSEETRWPDVVVSVERPPLGFEASDGAAAAARRREADAAVRPTRFGAEVVVRPGALAAYAENPTSWLSTAVTTVRSHHRLLIARCVGGGAQHLRAPSGWLHHGSAAGAICYVHIAGQNYGSMRRQWGRGERGCISKLLRR